MTAYETTKLNRVRQLRDKAKYDSQVVHDILDAGLVAQVGFTEDQQPVVVPMLYGREDETLFLHGARKARIIRLLEQTERACLNVTHLDALVFARSAFNSSMNYRSVTVFGRPRLVSTSAQKLHALKVITEATMPGRWNELREPLEREIKMTGVIALDIESASAKVSTGMPEDEDEDYAIPVWAGILPFENQFGVAVADDRILPGVAGSDAVMSLQNKRR